MHLPYLRQVLGDNFKIVPIIVGNLSPKRTEELGGKLAKYFDDADTVFVISSDFCHWGGHFDYQPQQKEVPIHEFISALDHQGMSLIEQHDLKGFSHYIEQTENTICGQNPIKVLLSTISHSTLKLSTSFVQYDQSEKVTTPAQTSVSYASAITFVAE
jgi:AmmeMemoRadiSam system protein B